MKMKILMHLVSHYKYFNSDKSSSVQFCHVGFNSGEDTGHNYHYDHFSW